MDDTDASPPSLNTDIETEVKEMMGLFDTPAFARRGQDLEITLRRLHERCRTARGELLDMVQLRLRQWSRATIGPKGWSSVFVASIEPLWLLAEAEPPQWAESPAPIGRQRTIANDLVTAVLRFNRRWPRFLDQLNLEPVNTAIDRYNRYYVLEKECVLGSARLAARHFQPVHLVSTCTLMRDHPQLPVPEIRARRRRETPRDSFLSTTKPEPTGNHDCHYRLSSRTGVLARTGVDHNRHRPGRLCRGQTTGARSASLKQGRAASGLAFEVRYQAAPRSEPIKGRVYVFLEPEGSSIEPRTGPNWFRPAAVFRR